MHIVMRYGNVYWTVILQGCRNNTLDFINTVFRSEHCFRTYDWRSHGHKLVELSVAKRMMYYGMFLLNLHFRHPDNMEYYIVLCVRTCYTA